MPTKTYKRLGNVSPAAATVTPLYSVPAAAAALTSSLVICNTNPAVVTVRVSHAAAANPDAAVQYIYYDHEIDPNDTFIATIGLTMASIDVMRCYASTTGVNFHLYGAEIT